MKSNEKTGVNRRALPGFFLWVLGGAALGFGAGIVSAMVGITDLGEAIPRGLRTFLTAVAPWGIPVTSAVLLGSALVLYRRARRLCDSWDGEEEATPERVEETLTWVILLTSLTMLADFFFMGVDVTYVAGAGSGVKTMLVVAEMLLSCGALVVLQQKTVDLTRRLNPEKTVSVYDRKFQEKWMDTCDEAERAQIGQASYQAYRLGSGACLVLWVALLLGSYVFDIGLLAMSLPLLIWGVLQVSYTLACLRLGRRSAA